MTTTRCSVADALLKEYLDHIEQEHQEDAYDVDWWKSPTAVVQDCEHPSKSVVCDVCLEILGDAE